MLPRYVVLRLFLQDADFSPNDYLAFQYWAFGGTDQNSMTMWNELHGDLFKIKGSDIAIDMFKKMIEAYKDHRAQYEIEFKEKK